MSIDAINTVSFSGKKSYTKNGNEYEKTHAGKFVGMGVGASVGAGYPLLLLHQAQKDKPFLKRLLVSYRNAYKKGLANAGLDVSDIKLSAKTLSRGLKIIPAITGAVALILGLGLGSIVDGIINHARAKNADK